MAQTQQTIMYAPQPQPGHAVQPNVQMIPVQNGMYRHREAGYKGESTKKCVKVISILQISFGVICIFFQIGTIVLGNKHERLARLYNYDYYRGSFIDRYVGAGFWVGIYYVITGVTGLLSATRKSTGLIIAMMVLNIILAAAFSYIMIGLMGGSIAILSDRRCYYRYDYRSYYNYYSSYNRYFTTTTTIRAPCKMEYVHAALALDCIMLILSVINFIFGIVLSVVGCCNTCCKSSSQISSQPMVVYQAGVQPQQGYMIAQPGVVYAQPQTGFQGVTVAQPQPFIQGNFAAPTTNQPVYPQAGSSQPAVETGNFNQPGQTGSLPPAYQEKAGDGVHTQPQ